MPGMNLVKASHLEAWSRSLAARADLPGSEIEVENRVRTFAEARRGRGKEVVGECRRLQLAQPQLSPFPGHRDSDARHRNEK